MSKIHIDVEVESAHNRATPLIAMAGSVFSGGGPPAATTPTYIQ